MLVTRLVEYAGRAGAVEAFHRDRVLDWELALDLHGQPLVSTLGDLRESDDRGRLRGKVHPVPATVRTVGVAPNLAADDVQYVLGWGDESTKPERVARCHAAFQDLTRRWAHSDAGRDDPVAQALWAFYRDGHRDALVRPEGMTAKAGVYISVDGVEAYKAGSVRVFWAEEVVSRKGSSKAGAGPDRGLCLACGRVGALLESLPGKVPARLVPGATNDAALISVNEEVFGYGLTTKLGASPICVACGEAVTAGLVRALSSPETSASYGGQDARLAWWTTRPVAIDPYNILARPPSPAEIAKLLGDVHDGVDPAGRAIGDGERQAMFCSLSIGGNVARVVVRDWIEMPLPQLVENIRAWFDDHETAPLRTTGRRHHGIGALAMVCGRWVGARNQYDEFGLGSADRPRDVHRELVRAALRGVPLPPSVLTHLMHRIRTDGHVDDPRAALLRLALTRRPRPRGTTDTPERPVPSPGLDPDNTDPAYVSGRAFALLEQIQYDVNRASGGQLTTTYGDRYFAGAVSNPRAALLNGRRDANAWIRKLRRIPGKDGLAYYSMRKLDDVFELLGPVTNMPGRLTLPGQALFVLGYHHQRSHHFAEIARRTAAKAERTTSDGDTTADPVDDPDISDGLTEENDR